MPQRPYADDELREAVAAYEEHGRNKTHAASALNISPSTLRGRLRRAVERGLLADPDAAAKRQQDLKVLRLEKSITELRAELKRAQAECLTAAGVRQFIIGVEDTLAGDDPDPAWTEALDRGENRLDGDVPTIFWSDFHAGEVVRPEQVFNSNEYNMGIMRARFNRLVDNTVFMFKQHLSARRYPGIVVMLGGDMVTGDIHTELSETNEEYVMPVLMETHRMLRRGIRRLADVFGQVYVVTAYGNHGRTNQKPQHKDQAFKNFDWLLYCWLAEWFQGDPRITFKIPDDDEVQFLVAGHRYRLTHGSQFRGGQGFIGALAPIMRGEHKKRIASQSYGMPYDTLVIAHWHQCIWGKRLVVNGSVKGYDEYAIDLQFEFEEPKQWAWLTSKSFGKCSPMEIYCDTPGVSTFSGQDWWERGA